MRDVMKRARILLVDGDEVFRLRVQHILEQEEGMEIVGDFASAEEALSTMEALRPNIVLMDTWLPGMNGIEACRRLTGNGPDCDVIILSPDQELIHVALKAGAAGYFPKEIKQKELATAIRLACKWQSLKEETDGSIYSIRQIEAMIMENLTKFTTKQTHDEEQPERLSPEDNSSSLTPEVTLVVPSPGDASQLQRFICRAEMTLQASLLETVGAWNDTHITFRLRRPASLADIADKLAKMPEVEEVEEKVPVRAGRFSFFKKIGATPEKTLSVTLSRQPQPSTTARRTTQYPRLPKLQPQPVGSMIS